MRNPDGVHSRTWPWWRDALCLGLAASLGSTLACSSPTRPTASVVAAEPVSPTSGSQLSYYSQPVALLLSKSVATSGATATTTVDIATDASFTTVTSVSATVDTTTGQLKATVDHLQASTTYYWRARTVANETSLTSTVSRFTIGPPVVVQPPQPISPTGSVEGRRPVLTLANAARTGPSGAIRYQFEIAIDPGFLSVVSSGTVDEGGSDTRFTPSGDLEPGRTFYWRAQAIDALTGATSPVTPTSTFRTLFAVVDGPFRLTIRMPNASCAPSYPMENVFDGSVQTLGTRLKFVARSPFLDLADPMTMDVTRTGEVLAGGASGFADTPSRYWMLVIGGPARVSGSVIGTSSLSGVMEGELWIGYRNYGLASGCSGVYTWTLIRQ